MVLIVTTPITTPVTLLQKAQPPTGLWLPLPLLKALPGASCFPAATPPCASRRPLGPPPPRPPHPWLHSYPLLSRPQPPSRYQTPDTHRLTASAFVLMGQVVPMPLREGMMVAFPAPKTRKHLLSAASSSQMARGHAHGGHPSLPGASATRCLVHAARWCASKPGTFLHLVLHGPRLDISSPKEKPHRTLVTVCELLSQSPTAPAQFQGSTGHAFSSGLGRGFNTCQPPRSHQEG